MKTPETVHTIHRIENAMTKRAKKKRRMRKVYSWSEGETGLIDAGTKFVNLRIHKAQNGKLRFSFTLTAKPQKELSPELKDLAQEMGYDG